LTVGDIYGGVEVPASLNLPSYVIASVFGKAQPEAPAGAVARSIYNLLAINTAQLAYLHASLIGCDKIVFAFIQSREVEYRMNKFLQFWCKGTIQTVFCTHPELLASAGTLVLPGDSTTYEEHRFDETCTSLQVSVDDQIDSI
jgi:pantothenate kinase